MDHIIDSLFQLMNSVDTSSRFIIIIRNIIITTHVKTEEQKAMINYLLKKKTLLLSVNYNCVKTHEKQTNYWYSSFGRKDRLTIGSLMMINFG